jgi:hypothetical protein
LSKTNAKANTPANATIGLNTYSDKSSEFVDVSYRVNAGDFGTEVTATGSRDDAIVALIELFDAGVNSVAIQRVHDFS